MAPRPRSYPALAALLWIALAICGLTAPAAAHTTPGDHGTVTFGTAPNPWSPTAPLKDLLADAENEFSGDGLVATLRPHEFVADLQPVTGRAWLSTRPRFLIPFETGPPAA